MGTFVETRKSTAATILILVMIITAIVLLVIDCEKARAAAPGEEMIFGADSPVFNDGGDQQGPAISGNIVFWTELGSYYLPGATIPSWRQRIFYKDLAKGAAEPGRTLIEGELGASTPAMSLNANRVVWQEGQGTVEHIYYKDVDFSTGYGGCPGTVFECAAPVSPTSDWQENPSISPDASKVAWEDGVGHGSRVHLYDFNTGIEQEVFPVEGGDQIYPSVDNEWIVWTDNRDFGAFVFPYNSAIYAKRIGSSEPARAIVTNNCSNADASGYPFPIGNDYISVSSAKLGRNQNDEPVVVYIMAKGYGFGNYISVHLYNLSNGVDMELEKKDWGLTDPAVDGDKVIWSDCSGGWDRCEIVMHDLTTGRTQTVSAGPKTAYSGAVHPVISARSGFIAWQDYRDGMDIYFNRTGDTAQALAEKYRPELKMSKYENFEPMPVEQFLGSQGTLLKKRNDENSLPVLNPTKHDLASVAGIADYYIDLSGDSILAGGGNPSISVNRSYIHDNYVEPYLSHRNQFPTVVYARIVSQPGSRKSTAIQYWINYYANDHPQLFHEGDWELIQVDLDEKLQPYRADYSRHGGGLWRHWNDVEKSARFPEQPVAYVSTGSHANYFHSDDFDIKKFVSWDSARGDGNSLYPQVKVIPEPNQSSGTEFEWVNFQGQWGEYTNANIGAFHIGPWGGQRDGADNPTVQGYWLDPFSWNDNVCDGCQDEAESATDLEITGSLSVDLEIIDAQGRHAGGNMSAGSQKIPGSESLEYPELGRKSVIIHNTDVSSGYRINVTGNSNGSCDLTLSVPDHSGGVVDTLKYKSIPVSPASSMNFNIAQSKDYILYIDADGSGEASPKVPDESSTANVDFIPPARVTDLQVLGAVQGGVTKISFTAPGDDVFEGSASAYDIRYSTSPIDDGTWKEAIPVSGLTQPLEGGNRQTIAVERLEDGMNYYFALRACDETGHCSSISNTATTAATPRLSWEMRKVYWSSFGDYLEARLTVDYKMRNVGGGKAISPMIVGSHCSPDYITTSTQFPLQVDDMAPGEFVIIPLKYSVTTTVHSFITFTRASCEDETGKQYSFPGGAK